MCLDGPGDDVPGMVHRRRMRSDTYQVTELALRSRRPWILVHGMLAALVCVVIPAESWLEGSGTRAWTMYSTAGSYRLRVLARDEQGDRWIASTALAAHASGELMNVLSGAETFRAGPQRIDLRSRLAALAELACASSHAKHVTLLLEASERAHGPVVQTTTERACSTP